MTAVDEPGGANQCVATWQPSNMCRTRGDALRERACAYESADMSHFDNADLALAAVVLLATLVSVYRTTGQRASKLVPGRLAGMRSGSRAAVAFMLLIAVRILTH